MACPRSIRPVLIHITNHGARDTLTVQLQAMDYRRGADYLMVG